MLPLFAKYRTLSGNRYAYDVQTGQILRVSDVVYEILDDYRVLTPDEICRKHPALDKGRPGTPGEIDAQQQGWLCDHTPEIPAKVEALCCEKRRESICEFLRHTHHL